MQHNEQKLILATLAQEHALHDIHNAGGALLLKLFMDKHLRPKLDLIKFFWTFSLQPCINLTNLSKGSFLGCVQPSYFTGC